jgi:hypothetical protein
MDRVERAQLGQQELAGGSENTIVESHELDPRQDGAGAGGAALIVFSRRGPRPPTVVRR